MAGLIYWNWYEMQRHFSRSWWVHSEAWGSPYDQCFAKIRNRKTSLDLSAFTHWTWEAIKGKL